MDVVVACMPGPCCTQRPHGIVESNVIIASDVKLKNRVRKVQNIFLKGFEAFVIVLVHFKVACAHCKQFASVYTAVTCVILTQQRYAFTCLR